MRVLHSRVAFLSVLMLALQLPLLTPAAATRAPGLSAAHAISVSGKGVGMYPTFSPEVERYAVTTTAATGGVLDVDLSSSSGAGTILVNGRPVAPGQVRLEGLEDGEEISVIFQDSAGTQAYSLVYLPARFPAMTEVVPAAPGTIAAGELLRRPEPLHRRTQPQLRGRAGPARACRTMCGRTRWPFGPVT